jgi:hypothetical protein
MPNGTAICIFTVTIIIACSQQATACNPLFYDTLVNFTNQSQLVCNTPRHDGCLYLSYPTCDMRFSTVAGGSADEVSSCSACKQGWYLPEGPAARLCSIQNGTSHYREQKKCKSCRAATGICTELGTTLEVCTQDGRSTDAQCVNCTNAPLHAVYTGPSPTNLNVCPYECASGHYSTD